MLYTVGYEGLNIHQFLNMLDKYNIDKIIDIRERPISRKPGFSKNILREELQENGIEYAYIPALGCPKEIRINYKADAEWIAYTKKFKAYVKTQDAALAEVMEMMTDHTCALLCFEANPQLCHRSLVAAELIRRYAVQVRHADVVAAKTSSLELTAPLFA